MSKARFGIGKIVGFMVVVGLLGGALYFGLRQRRAEAQHTVELTPDISLRLAAVLTKANPELILSNGLLSVPDKVTGWEAVKALNRYLPAELGLIPYTTIPSHGLASNSLELVYLVGFPEGWITSRKLPDIQRDIDKALADSHIKYARVKIAEGSYGRRGYVQDNTYSYGFSTLGLRAYHPYLYVTLEDVPVFQRELIVEFGENRYDTKKHREVFKIVSSATLTNPLYRDITPLTSTDVLPATRTNGDYEVTLQAAVAQVDREQSSHYGSGWSDRIRKLPEGKKISTDLFPLGNSQDPAGLSSVLVMSVKDTKATESDWQATFPKITYGKEDIPISSEFLSGSTQASTSIYSYPVDLSVFPQPLKITIQLKHDKNLLPDEEQTVELPLPKEGELMPSDAELVIWNKRIKIRALGYKTTQSLENVVPASQRVYTTAGGIRPEPDSFFFVTESASGNGIFDMKMLGPNAEELMLNSGGMKCTNMIALQSIDLKNIRMPKSPFWWEKSKPFRYEDYTTLSLTLRDGRTSPVLYEFVTTPQIATGKAPVDGE